MEHAHSAGQASASGSTGAFSQPAPQAGFSSSVADESLHLVQGELPIPVAPGVTENPQLPGSSAAQSPASALSHWADVAPSENHHRRSDLTETSPSGTEEASGAQGSGISSQLLDSISEAQPKTDTPHERSALDTTEPSVFDGVADREPATSSTESPAPSEVEDQNPEPESKQEQQQEECSAHEKESAHDSEKESAHDSEKESAHDSEKESAHDEEQAPGQSGKSDGLAHTMRQMEQSYGQDFGQVGVSPTLQSSEAGGAKAVATEEHIAYDPASVDLSSHEGKKILGHELSHIVQKRKGQVVSDAVDHQIDPESAYDEPHQSQHEPHETETDQSSQRESLEQEADDAGERAANGQPAHVAAGAKAPRNQFFGLKDIGKFATGAWNQTKKGASGVWNTVKNADWKKIGKTTLDVATDFIPGISNVKDAYQAISGVNPVTGEKLGWGARIFSGICAIPGVGNIAKGIFKYGGKLLGKLGGKLLSKFGGKLLSKLGSLKNVGKSVWNGVKGVGKSVWNGVKGVGKSVWNGVKGVGKSVWNGVKGIGKSVWNGVKGVGKSVWNGMKGVGKSLRVGFKNAGDWTKDNVNKLRRKARELYYRLNRTKASGRPNQRAVPDGRPTTIPNKADPDTRRSLIRENESAQTLAQSGYKIKQNPPTKQNGTNPDYLIEGRIFDCYAPASKNPRNIWDYIKKEKIEKGQTERVVLNLSDSKVNLAELKQQFQLWEIKGLKEVIVIKDKSIIPFYP